MSTLSTQPETEELLALKELHPCGVSAASSRDRHHGRGSMGSPTVTVSATSISRAGSVFSTWGSRHPLVVERCTHRSIASALRPGHATRWLHQAGGTTGGEGRAPAGISRSSSSTAGRRRWRTRSRSPGTPRAGRRSSPLKAPSTAAPCSPRPSTARSVPYKTQPGAMAPEVYHALFPNPYRPPAAVAQELGALPGVPRADRPNPGRRRQGSRGHRRAAAGRGRLRRSAGGFLTGVQGLLSRASGRCSSSMRSRPATGARAILGSRMGARAPDILVVGKSLADGLPLTRSWPAR